MACTRVLHAIGGHSFPPARMPMDMALSVCLCQSPSLSKLLGNSSLKPLRPCIYKHDTLSPRSFSRSEPPSPPSSYLFPNRPVTLSRTRRKAPSPKKKHVVFADSKGLALTSVRFFSSEEPTSPTSFGDDAAQTQSPDLWTSASGLRPGLSRPPMDLLSARPRGPGALVRLETCSVAERVLSGTVRALNMGPEKAVYLRVSCDSWMNHRSVPCTSLQQWHAASETHLFAFDISFHQNLDLHKGLELCFSFQPGGSSIPLWDNSHDHIYHVHIEPKPADCSLPLAPQYAVSHALPRSPRSPKDVYFRWNGVDTRRG